ncbi:unnamed protein product [Allacma fusca]|uniref:Uncharacterized protein n=1 Tax=Allacma fusca TaxID=39272 RepID=A0A8J2K4N9_9HEXA|nr:unnamed protein product [Allacma fusca]
MVALNLIELFVIIFFVIFLVVLFYAVIRRSCKGGSSSGPSGTKRRSAGSANSGERNEAGSESTAARQNTQTIYLGRSNEVGVSGGSSIYTIPINSLDLTRTSVLIVRNVNSGPNGSHSITLRIPPPIVEEPPPSYDTCVPLPPNPPSYTETTAPEEGNIV